MQLKDVTLVFKVCGLRTFATEEDAEAREVSLQLHSPLMSSRSDHDHIPWLHLLFSFVSLHC